MASDTPDPGPADLTRVLFQLSGISAGTLTLSDPLLRELPARVAAPLRDVLDAEFAYVCLEVPGLERLSALERRPGFVVTEAQIQERLAGQMPSQPSGDGLERLAVGLGTRGELGLLSAGCRREGFPTQAERILMDTTAFQLTTALYARMPGAEPRERMRAMAESAPALLWTTGADSLYSRSSVPAGMNAPDSRQGRRWPWAGST